MIFCKTKNNSLTVHILHLEERLVNLKRGRGCLVGLCKRYSCKKNTFLEKTAFQLSLETLVCPLGISLLYTWIYFRAFVLIGKTYVQYYLLGLWCTYHFFFFFFFFVYIQLNGYSHEILLGLQRNLMDRAYSTYNLSISTA